MYAIAQNPGFWAIVVVTTRIPVVKLLSSSDANRVGVGKDHQIITLDRFFPSEQLIALPVIA